MLLLLESSAKNVNGFFHQAILGGKVQVPILSGDVILKVKVVVV